MKGVSVKSYCCTALLVSISLAMQVRGDDRPNAEDFKVLKRADLKQFEGVWVMKVETKKGWKGTIRATIALYDAGSKEEDFARVTYDYDLARGKETSSIKNAPLGGIAFAGVSQGKKLLRVTSEREGFEPTVPFKVEPKKEMSAPVTVTKDQLQLDVSRSVKSFCFPLSDFDLEWDRLEFAKSK